MAGPVPRLPRRGHQDGARELEALVQHDPKLPLSGNEFSVLHHPVEVRKLIFNTYIHELQDEIKSIGRQLALDSVLLKFSAKLNEFRSIDNCSCAKK